MNCPMFQLKGPLMNKGEYSPAFPLKCPAAQLDGWWRVIGTRPSNEVGEGAVELWKAIYTRTDQLYQIKDLSSATQGYFHSRVSYFGIGSDEQRTSARVKWEVFGWYQGTRDVCASRTARHAQKDMRLALALGDTVNQPMPVATAANEVFKTAIAMVG